MLASAAMSCSSVSSSRPFECPDAPFQVQPRCRAAPHPSRGERSRKEPVAPAAGALSERCTQFGEHILFLGPPICQEEKKNEGNAEAEAARVCLRTFAGHFCCVYTLIRTSKQSHETWTCVISVSAFLLACLFVCVRMYVPACVWYNPIRAQHC